MKTPAPHTAEASALDKREFYTDNPRHLRVLALLFVRPARREELDARAGASNSPDLIKELRRRGLKVPCERIEAIDRDGRKCRPGIYHLTNSDKARLRRWMRSRNSGVITPEFAAWLAVIAGPLAVWGASIARLLGWF